VKYVDLDQESDDQDTPIEHAMFSRAQRQPLPKLTVQSIYGANSRRDVVLSKSSWDRDRFGSYNPRPRSYEDDFARAKNIYDTANYWEDDRFSTTSSKNSLLTRTQGMSLGDEAQYAKKLEVVRRSTPSPHSELLLSDYRKHLEHYESDQDNDDDDRVEYIHEAKYMETEDLGQELNYARSPIIVKDDVLDPVYNGPPRTRHMTRLNSYVYPSPVIPDDDDGAGTTADSKTVKRHDNETLDGSSTQTITTSASKPINRSVNTTPRSAKLRTPRSGTAAPTGGHTKYNLHNLRSSNATEALAAVWPPLSAPGATLYDQIDDSSPTATTSPCDVQDVTSAAM
jgi:hypothetical protein